MKKTHYKKQDQKDNIHIIKLAMKITVISIIFSMLEGLVMNKRYTRKEIMVFLIFNFLTNYVISCIR